MKGRPGVKIDRLVIAGRKMSNAEARELAERIAEELGRNFSQGVPSVSLATLSIAPNAPRGLGLRQLGQLVTLELKRKLL